MSNIQNILISKDDQIAIMTINRPDKLNALNKETLQELRYVFQKVCLDNDVRAIIITGGGEKAFVAGADIAEIAALDTTASKEFSENGQQIFKMIEECNKPVIAAINGFALGGGCELALACHLRLASGNAKLGLPEVSLGILPAFGGTQRLTLLLGKGKALELMLTGKMIGAEEAKALGLVNKVVASPSELLPACKELIKDMLKNAPLSLSKVIAAANAAYRKDGYNVEAHCFADLIESEDFIEGTKAFLEKRKPHFRGV